jgi:hypothetical protein
MTEPPAAEFPLDPFFAELNYQLIEMLRSFSRGDSFKDIGVRFKCDERTVSRQLGALDEAFFTTQHEHILYRPSGKGSYQLTPAGKILVDLLEPIIEATHGAVEAAASSTKRVKVICTSNCLEFFRELSNALPADRSFDPIPEARRTAEINLGRSPEMDPTRSDTGVFLASVLMSRAQNAAVGTVCPCNDMIEVLPVKVEPLQLLSPDDLGLRSRITVRQVIEAGVTLVVPVGGVAWDFLNWSYPDWRRLRPFQHVAATDLDFGLKCLARKLIPRSAMVVHGLGQDMLERYSLGDARLLEFDTGGSHSMVAVTGVFHSRASESQYDDDPYELIWETAQSIWEEKERVI